ncbi:MAG: 2-alkenal reductase [Candidatus Moranbacteria bacterium GW2011_GWA2_39_41]|nr:MAG: 2-alkenal reductase [Candidatus Moranbacteria bacterium GW2011_GWA2_39_41]
MTKKITKKIIFILVLMVFGGFGGVIADRYFFPYLSTTKLFSKYEFLKKGSEDITIINRTEQITVKEETSISKIANQVSSSVVNIVSYADNGAKGTSAKNAVASKNGTGVVVTGDGIVMTYASAINLVDSKYQVMTYNGAVYEASLFGVDSFSNLAFLSINADNLSSASFADSDNIRGGEKVIAVANSFGSYTNRYAAGLISDFNPEYNLAGFGLSSSEKLEGVYEADLNFQKYFIGGSVIDYTGQIVGMVGAIEKNNMQSFFLIPSNKIKLVIERAIKKELGMNPTLGIYYVPLSKIYALQNNLGVEAGALIYSASGQQGLAVITNSPAQAAGLKLNDIITAVNDQKITLEKSLPDLLYLHKKGEKIDLTILRDGMEIMITVKL